MTPFGNTSDVECNSKSTRSEY